MLNALLLVPAKDYGRQDQQTDNFFLFRMVFIVIWGNVGLSSRLLVVIH